MISDRSGIKAQFRHVPPSCVEPFLWVGLSSLRDVGMFLEFCQESVAERIKQDMSETRELALIVYLWTSYRKLGVLFMLFLYILTEISGVGPIQGQASGS